MPLWSFELVFLSPTILLDQACIARARRGLVQGLRLWEDDIRTTEIVQVPLRTSISETPQYMVRDKL